MPKAKKETMRLEQPHRLKPEAPLNNHLDLTGLARPATHFRIHPIHQPHRVAAAHPNLTVEKRQIQLAEYVEGEDQEDGG